MQCFPFLFFLITAPWSDGAMVWATDAPIQCAMKTYHPTEGASPCRPFPFWRSSESGEVKTSNVHHAFEPEYYSSGHDPVYDEAVYGITASCKDLPEPQTHTPVADPRREYEDEKTGYEVRDDMANEDSIYPFDGCWSDGRANHSHDHTDPTGAFGFLRRAADSFSCMCATFRVASQTLQQMFISAFAW